MNEDFFKQQLNSEVESLSFNKLNELGNHAVQLGLIVGHGYHQGKYEILHQDQSLLMSEKEAQTYLENLLNKMK